jgi:hypothetical protein
MVVAVGDDKPCVFSPIPGAETRIVIELAKLC